MRSGCSYSGNARASAAYGAWTAPTGRSKSILKRCAPTSSNAVVSMPAKRSARSPGAVDVAVGRNVRSWRIARGISQTQLGNRLGVSFQQVQKYEAGGNRIATGRLVKIAATLGVPISTLFQGTGRADRSQSLLALLSDSRSFRL